MISLREAMSRKTKDRKRHIAVDVPGLVLAVVVHSMVKYNPHNSGSGYASDFPDRLLKFYLLASHQTEKEI